MSVELDQQCINTIRFLSMEKKLESSPDGLTQAEAQKRLTQYGPNKPEEKQANPFLKFLGYFWGPIPWVIEAAVIFSALAQHWPDFWEWAAFVWGYALVWSLVNDRVKLLAYRVFDPAAAPRLASKG